MLSVTLSVFVVKSSLTVSVFVVKVSLIVAVLASIFRFGMRISPKSSPILPFLSIPFTIRSDESESPLESTLIDELTPFSFSLRMNVPVTRASPKMSSLCCGVFVPSPMLLFITSEPRRMCPLALLIEMFPLVLTSIFPVQSVMICPPCWTSYWSRSWFPRMSPVRVFVAEDDGSNELILSTESPPATLFFISKGYFALVSSTLTSTFPPSTTPKTPSCTSRVAEVLQVL